MKPADPPRAVLDCRDPSIASWSDDDVRMLQERYGDLVWWLLRKHGGWCEWDHEALSSSVWADFLSRWRGGSAGELRRCLSWQVTAALQRVGREQRRQGVNQAPRTGLTRRGLMEFDAVEGHPIEDLTSRDMVATLLCSVRDPRQRFAVDAWMRGETFVEMARPLGVSRERARQLFDKAVGLMQAAARSRGLLPPLTQPPGGPS